MTSALRYHLEASKRVLAGVSHTSNDIEAGIHGPRAHDWEYVIAFDAAILPDHYDWLRKKLRWEDE